MSGPNNYNQHIIEQFRANGGKADYPGPLVLLRMYGDVSARAMARRTNVFVSGTDRFAAAKKAL
jgi:hypothetical protein